MNRLLYTGVAGIGVNTIYSLLGVTWAIRQNWNREHNINRPRCIGHIWHGRAHWLSEVELAEANSYIREENISVLLLYCDEQSLAARIHEYRQGLAQGKYPGGSPVTKTGYNFVKELETDEAKVTRGIHAQQQILRDQLFWQVEYDTSEMSAQQVATSILTGWE